jgi:hypothetical protein
VAELVVRSDDLLPLLFWLPTLWGGGALVLLGVFGLASHHTLRTVSVVVGTCLGLVPSFWTIVMPVLGPTLIFLKLVPPARPAIASDGEP